MYRPGKCWHHWERIRLYTDDLGCEADLEKLTCTTFHGFGDRIIRENYQELGFTEPPRLIDEVEKSKIVAKLLKEITVIGLDYRNFKANLPYVKGALTTASSKRFALSISIIWYVFASEISKFSVKRS